MNYFIRNKRAGLLTAIIAAFMLFQCKGPETIVVSENPSSAGADTVSDDTTASEPSAAFRQINIGEPDRIPTLDPLFAENTGTMRALQLLYEGLVRYDSDGNVVPASAKSWTVSPDSLTYTFTLYNDIYYHDSDIFSSGIGRKLVASDVKYVFERMAQPGVPAHAAGIFMNIKGFEPFFKEQHHIYIPADRHLHGVSGISVTNDSTVTFSLVRKDSLFLEKLASPYALIYPHEAVTQSGASRFRAVGSGPFSLSRQRGDSLYIFSKFKNYHFTGQPAVNRVDISVTQREDNLFKAFARGDIHLIPQLGLQTARQVINANGNLRQGYTPSYNLMKGEGKTRYSLNWNPEADPDQHKARYVTQVIDTSFSFSGLPADFIAINRAAVADSTYNFSASDSLAVAFTENNYARHFINLLGIKLQERGVHLTFSPIRVPTRHTGLYTRQFLPSYPGETWQNENLLTAFSVPHIALYVKEFRKLKFNKFPWWFNLRETTLPVIDNL